MWEPPLRNSSARISNCSCSSSTCHSPGDQNIIKAGELYKNNSKAGVKDKILQLFQSDKNAGFVMEFYKESADEEKETTGELNGWMSQYDIAKICNWNLAIKGHQILLDQLLPGLASNAEWDETKPYEAMMKKAGELRYWFTRDMIAKNEHIKTQTDRELGKLNKTGT